MILSPFEWTIAKRYLLPGKGEAFIALVASISIGVVMLSVAMLIVVMSVMNGFRAELLDKIVGLNGHAIVQAYGGRMDDWENILEEVRATPGVVDASPLIEQPLAISFNGRIQGVSVRGNTDEDLAELADKTISGDFSELQAGAGKLAIGVRLAENIGIDTVADYQRLGPILRARGYSDEDVAKIMYRNWQRFYEQHLPANECQ